MRAGTLPQRVFDARVDLAHRRKLARRDFSTYLELVARDNYRRPIRQAWLHRTWQGHLWWCWGRGLHPVIMAPWGSGKTVQLAVEFPVWWLGRHRDLRVSVISNIEDNAKKRASAAKARITARPATQLVFPDLRAMPGPSSSFSFSLEGTSASPVDPSYQAWGIFGSGIGTRIDLAVFDDVVDQGNAILRPALRPQVIEQIDAVWLSRLEPGCAVCGGTGLVGGLEAWETGSEDPCQNCGGTGGGRAFSIGTAWHSEDYWHNRMRTPGFVVLVQRVDATRTGYSCEVFGVPEGETYPSLEELVRIASPRGQWAQIDEALGEAQIEREELAARRLAAGKGAA